MSKVTDARIAAIKALFETGDRLTEDNFADLIDAIQEAAQEHQHVSGGGAGSGTGDAGPVINLQSGTAANKPGSPAVGDIYIETDTGKVHFCISAGNWDTLKVWKTIVFTVPGVLKAGTQVAPTIIVDAAMEIDHVYGYVRTPSSVSAVIADVNKNGTSIFTNQGNRVWLVAGDNEDQTDTPGVTSLLKNDRLDIDLDQVDSGGAAADLTVEVRGKQDLTF